MPKRSHQGYGKLTKRLRRTIKTLSVFLRLAETLDRSRNGIVRKVEVQQRNGKLRLDVYATSDSELRAATSQSLSHRRRLWTSVPFGHGATKFAHVAEDS